MRKLNGMDMCRFRGGRGDRGSGPPALKIHKIIGFLCNTGPDPLKNHKATKPAFNVGPSSARKLFFRVSDKARFKPVSSKQKSKNKKNQGEDIDWFPLLIKLHFRNAYIYNDW